MRTQYHQMSYIASICKFHTFGCLQNVLVKRFKRWVCGISDQEDKGPSAKDVMLLGSAGNQVQQMKAMGYGWGKGDWGKGSYGKGWDWGKGGFPGYGYDMWMPMQMPVWGKGFKGW